MQTLNGSLNNFITGSTYNASSQLTQLTFNNGAVTDYTYNAQNLRLTDIVTTKSGATLLDLDYTFDNVGNVLTVKDNIGTGGLTTYAYDDLNRLMSATATLSNTYTRSWTYTTIGNIQTRNDGGGALTYTGACPERSEGTPRTNTRSSKSARIIFVEFIPKHEGTTMAT